MQQQAKWPEVQEWLSDPEFNSQDFNTKQRILENYFDQELADQEFYVLDYEEQQRIKNNFTSAHIGEAPVQAIQPPEEQTTALEQRRQTPGRYTPELIEGAKDYARGTVKGIADVVETGRMTEDEFQEAIKTDPRIRFFAPDYKIRREKSELTETGKRADGTPKGPGYFGALTLPGGGVATEYSVGVKIGGKETEIPTLVPTLTEKELNQLVNDIIPNKKEVPKEIVNKAVEHAKQRIKEGKSPFLEKQTDLFETPSFPEFQKETAQKLYDTYDELAQGFLKEKELPTRDHWADRWMADFVRVAPQMAGMMTQAAIGGPVVGTMGMGLYIAGATSESMEKAGVPRETAIKLGLANAIMQAPLEMIGAGKILSAWSPQRTALIKLRKIVEAAGTEWFTEFAQAYPEKIVHLIAENPDDNELQLWNKFLDDFGETALSGAYEGTLTAPWALLGISGGGEYGGRDVLETKEPEKKKVLTGKKKAEVDAILDNLGYGPAPAAPETEGPQLPGGPRIPPTRTGPPSAIPPEMMEGYQDAEGIRPDEGQVLPGEVAGVEEAEPEGAIVEPGEGAIAEPGEDESREDLEREEPEKPRIKKPLKPKETDINKLALDEADFFEKAVQGKLHKAKGKPAPFKIGSGETPISLGMSEGYAPEDIYHFYISRRMDDDWVDLYKADRSDFLLSSPEFTEKSRMDMVGIAFQEYLNDLQMETDRLIKKKKPAKPRDEKALEEFPLEIAPPKSTSYYPFISKHASVQNSFEKWAAEHEARERAYKYNKDNSSDTMIDSGYNVPMSIQDAVKQLKMYDSDAKSKAGRLKRGGKAGFNVSPTDILETQWYADKLRSAINQWRKDFPTGWESYLKGTKPAKPSKRSLKSYQEEVDKLFPDEGFTVDLIGAEGEMVKPGELLITGRKEGTDLYKETFAVPATDIKAGVEKKRRGLIDEKARALSKRKTGVMYKEKVEVAETGEIIEGERDASEALKDVQSDLEGYRKLLDCIRS